MRSVATDHVVEQLADVQAVEQPLGVAQRLVGQHRHARMPSCRLQHLAHPRIELRRTQEALVVDLEEAAQGGWPVGQFRRRQCPADEDRRSLPHHADDGVLGQRLAAQLHHQLIGRISEVAAGIDQRAVEIERDQPSGTHYWP